jgi:hypothetical protein
MQCFFFLARNSLYKIVCKYEKSKVFLWFNNIVLELYKAYLKC